ncbi:type III-A CRISPR-associated RAMP protein Csm4 [Flavihumibacter profundi]|uniref:type III-A CRISPR-associated RAMP protein Csm4 n=1 Tax=Flavihumibacter profundi TaxID=2716883 RepID=UPI001CC3A0E3|nr:type III-A CRISPR-associated RAMP protein Csm4 [Flavihumibacter profundi]MBZ5857563.1 type III-A CRISPR-associated RAMP protein Csm4 [Flavihumibacter profundi]
MAELKFSCFRLLFHTPLHIGNERSDYASGSAFLSNDALMAAIYFAWARLGHPEWIPGNTTEAIPFAISSLFPFAGSEKQKTVYFFPRPLVKVDQEGNPLSTSLRKRIKKVKWVDLSILEGLLNQQPGDVIDEHLNGQFQSACPMGQKQILTSQVVPRSRVSRTGEEDTAIFYTERFFFRADSGLFFLFHSSELIWKDRIQAALNLLAEEGLGTDRNVGNGKFSWDKQENFTVKVPESTAYQVNLGLYCPENAGELSLALEGPSVGYDWVKRGGWLSEPYGTLRKRSIYMIREGSCLAIKSNDAYTPVILGKQVDVRPNEVHPPVGHPVWRNGRTLFLPCKQ